MNIKRNKYYGLIHDVLLISKDVRERARDPQIPVTIEKLVNSFLVSSFVSVIIQESIDHDTQKHQ